MENQILIALKNNKLLKNILFTELNLSNIKGNLLTLSEGEILYREGDKSEFLYLIVSGEMNVIRKKGSRRTLSEIFSDHDFFGSDEFIETSDRKSTAVALRDSYIISLSKVEVDSLIEQDDEILTNLYESLHQEEPEAEIDASGLDKVDFKKAGKQESSFADRVKKQKEIEAAGNSELDQNIENANDVGDPGKSVPETEDSLQKDEEDPFINAYSENIRSFSTIEPKKESESKKSFKEKIESGGEKESAQTDEEQVEQFTEEPVVGEDINQLDEEPSLNEDNSEPAGKDDRFPTTFEISFSYSDENKSPGSDEVSDNTNDSIGSENETPIVESSNGVEDTDESLLSELALTDPSLMEIPDEVPDENKEESADSVPEIQDFQTENTFPISDDPAEEQPPESDTASGSQELEDFYASISETESDLNTPREASEPLDDFSSGDETSDVPSDLTDDFNPFPELEGENPATEEEYPKEFDVGEQYNPDVDSEGASFQENPLADLGTESISADLIVDSDEDSPSLENQEQFTTPEPIENNDQDQSDFSDPEPEPEALSVETPEESTGTLKDYKEVDQSIDMLDKINKAAQVVNSNIQIDDVFKGIVDVATDLTNADRGTLYLADRKKNELWSKVAIGNEFKEIKLAMGEGIAGWVAQKGEVINLENVKDDPRFNASFDKTSGYETKTMICFPIKNKNEEIVGVLQLINSRNGKFSKLDEEFLEALSIHAAMALQNAELVEQLLTGERVSSLGKMANFLLQDIKKPIMVSKRYAEHLKSKMLDEDVSRVVDMLLDQLNHIADLVQSTSSYSEGQIVLRSMLCKLNETLDDYISRVDAILRASNCQIAKEFDNEINVKISPKQMYQCFQHIIKNACDAMPDGGTVYLSTKIEKDFVHIIVKDNGLGIPDSLHEKIFEPFMSHGKKEGTGLGLSITKKIIEEHGGTISVQSEMGEGATFTISLPIVYDM